MSTEILEDICDSIQSHPNIYRREARYKRHDHIKQIQSEWKVVFKDTRSMCKGLHKVFKTVVKDISKYLQTLGESG